MAGLSTHGSETEDATIFDVSFGMPLFHEAINYSICNRIRQKKLFSGKYVTAHKEGHTQRERERSTWPVH